MKNLPTQERALRKRNSLISAAIDQFSADGFETATAKSIAAAAGVATGTFYQYFENKNDILCVIASTRFAVLEQRIQLSKLYDVSTPLQEHSDVETLFLRTLEFVYEFHASEPELHQVLEQRRGVDPELQAIMDHGEEVLRKRVLSFVKTFNFAKPEIIADSLFAMAEGLVHRLVFSQLGQDPKESLELGAKMLASFFPAQQ